MILLVVLSVLATQGSAANDVTKPNIVIMYMDDMGWGDIGANGKITLINFVQKVPIILAIIKWYRKRNFKLQPQKTCDDRESNPDPLLGRQRC